MNLTVALPQLSKFIEQNAKKQINH